MSRLALRIGLVAAPLLGIALLAEGQTGPAKPADEPWQVAAAPPALVQEVPLRAAAGLQWRILENPNGRHTALFFDPTRQVFAVYHIDSGTGEIKLKSVRSLSADLRLPHYNSNNPAPRDIEAMLNESQKRP